MSQTRYLNVDLDIAGAFDLDNIIRELEPFAFVLNPGPQPFATLELHEQCETPEAAVTAFHRAITALSADARSAWSNLDRRTLNIGFQAGSKPYSTEFALSSGAIDLIAAISAEVVFTIYGSDGKR